MSSKSILSVSYSPRARESRSPLSFAALSTPVRTPRMNASVSAPPSPTASGSIPARSSPSSPPSASSKLARAVAGWFRAHSIAGAVFAASARARIAGGDEAQPGRSRRPREGERSTVPEAYAPAPAPAPSSAPAPAPAEKAARRSKRRFPGFPRHRIRAHGSRSGFPRSASRTKTRPSASATEAATRGSANASRSGARDVFETSSNKGAPRTNVIASAAWCLSRHASRCADAHATPSSAPLSSASARTRRRTSAHSSTRVSFASSDASLPPFPLPPRRRTRAGGTATPTAAAISPAKYSDCAARRFAQNFNTDTRSSRSAGSESAGSGAKTQKKTVPPLLTSRTPPGSAHEAETSSDLATNRSRDHRRDASAAFLSAATSKGTHRSRRSRSLAGPGDGDGDGDGDGKAEASASPGTRTFGGRRLGFAARVASGRGGPDDAKSRSSSPPTMCGAASRNTAAISSALPSVSFHRPSASALRPTPRMVMDPPAPRASGAGGTGRRGIPG